MTMNNKRDKVTIKRCSGCKRIIPSKDIRRDNSDWQIKPLTRDNIRDGFIEIRNAKGGRDRIIPINKNVRSCLRRLPLPLQQRALQKYFKKLAKEVLGRDLHWHCLRHSCGSYYLNEKGWNLRQVQLLLGHGSVSTTQIYTHVKPNQLKELMDEI